MSSEKVHYFYPYNTERTRSCTKKFGAHTVSVLVQSKNS